MVETSQGTDGGLEAQLLAMGNEVLHVRPKGPNLLEFKSNSESKWILGKVKASFEGAAKLDSAKKEVTYKDKVTKTSFGLGGEDAGFSKESFVIKGIERSGSGEGFVPSGDAYTYDFGKVREMVRGVVERNGWKFKVSLFFMPK